LGLEGAAALLGAVRPRRAAATAVWASMTCGGGRVVVVGRQAAAGAVNLSCDARVCADCVSIDRTDLFPCNCCVLMHASMSALAVSSQQ
jgi:hypothetical protein